MLYCTSWFSAIREEICFSQVFKMESCKMESRVRNHIHVMAIIDVTLIVVENVLTHEHCF